jgi:mannosyltransferase OCH1-like enzyme
VIHCIWLGSKTIPEIFWPCVESWVRHHPDWKVQLWRDDTLPPLSCQAEFERAKNFKAKYDIVRLELLRQLGGVIIDMDMEAIRPIDPLLEEVVAFAGHKGPYRKRIGTQVLGAVPHHPFFEQVVERLRETVGVESNSSRRSGPAFLGRAVAGSGRGSHDLPVRDLPFTAHDRATHPSGRLSGDLRGPPPLRELPGRP